jgi:hypothetical protein
MSFCEKHLALFKAEDPEGYAKLANAGVLLGYPVKIQGQTSRPDNKVDYHSSIKFFNPEVDHAHKIHEMAQHLPLNPPDAKNTQIKFDTFKDRMGNDVHTITLHGNSADKIKEHNAKFSHMGYPAKFEYTPHVSVDRATWDKLKSSGAKTAHEAGIEFGPAYLKKGPKVLKTYHHEPDSTEPKVPDHGDMTSKVKAPVTKAENVTGETPLMKPFVSDAQRRWAHTATGTKALGGKAGVHEWDEATKGRKLPEKVGKSENSTLCNLHKGSGIAGEPGANHVIGHTQSGKPVHYESNYHPSSKQFSPTDHADAAALHGEREKHHLAESKKIKWPEHGTPEHAKKELHEAMAQQHNRATYQHKFPSSELRMGKSEDDGQQRYHIHSNGVRITKSPLTIGEIKTTTGKFPKDLEKDPNTRVIPHYREVKRSESDIKQMIKKEHALHSRFAKAFALTGDTLRKYIEDNRDLKKALEGK